MSVSNTPKNVACPSSIPTMTQSTSCLETEGKGPVRCSDEKDKKTRQIGIFLFTRLGYTSSWGYSSVVQSLRSKNEVLNLLLGRTGAGQTESPHLKDSAFPRLGQQDGEPTTFSSGHKTLLCPTSSQNTFLS